MSSRQEQELINQMIDSFRSAASAVRQLGTIQRNSDLIGIALIIEEINKNASRIVTSKAMQRIALEGGLHKFSQVVSGEQPN